MDTTLIQSIWTVVVLIVFVGIVAWAYSKRRHDDFNEAAQLPLEDEIIIRPSNSTSEHTHV